MTSDEQRRISEDPAVTDYLAELTDRTEAILGSNLLGVYAAGSLALGSYQHGRSDVDIAIVCGDPLDLGSKERLVAALRHESLPCPARGLELVVYTAAVAAAGAGDPGFEVELNTGPRMDFRATYAGADRFEQDGLFWYAIDRSILAEHGRALVGLRASRVFAGVPEIALIELLTDSLRWHLGPVGDDEIKAGPAAAEPPASWTDDAVLNACRALRRVQTGHWFSKTVAGQQVMQGTHGGEPPSAPEVPTGVTELTAVVQQALAARRGGPPPGISATRTFQRRVLAELERTLALSAVDRRSADGR